MGDELFEATICLVEAIINKIQNYSHLSILKETLEFHLYIISELSYHGKGKSLKCYLDKTDDLLCQWINHRNVIGSNKIGGNNAEKLKDEVEVLIKM